jgi:FkbM family methyltransferase
MSETTGANLIAYEARRIMQTRRAFTNWAALLYSMAGERIGRGPQNLEFRTRSGALLTCPNVPGARLPMYEQFADDCYNLAWVLGTRPGDAGIGLSVLDVGAHVGAFAVNVALASRDTLVDCFEPSPETAAFLQRNVDANGLSDRVRVHEYAMAATGGTALLDDNAGGSVHNGLIKADHRLVDGSDALGRRSSIEVRTTTFDAAVRASRAPYDVVKMDCEGGEYGLVYASDPANWASVQRVVMEYHPVQGESWEQLRGWMATVGLQVVRHKSDSPGLGTAWLARDTTTAAK